jgi:hypothetical protein
MVRTAILATIVFALPAPSLAAATCAGADPAIVSVVVANVTPAAGVDQYHVTGTVTNRGTAGQASNVLQFVDIYQQGVRLDAKSIPPLGPGRSATFDYVALRSTDAGKGTTTLNFRMRYRQPVPPGSADCDASNDAFSLTF